MSKYHTPNESLRFVNLQICRICRLRSTPAGTNYALCNDRCLSRSQRFADSEERMLSRSQQLAVVNKDTFSSLR